MGREVRMVPSDWNHPKDENTGQFKPLKEGYKNALDDFMGIVGEKGLQAAIEECGDAPDKEDYMPDWPSSQKNHYMMYENTSEGTPLSPAFDNKEDLARWLADNGASAFGDDTATYKEWLAMIEDGYAPSMIIDRGAGKIMSGVAAAGMRTPNDKDNIDNPDF